MLARTKTKAKAKAGRCRNSSPGGEAADQTSQSSQSGMSAFGLRGVVLEACDVI
jgi:hypothetical protein